MKTGLFYPWLMILYLVKGNKTVSFVIINRRNNGNYLKVPVHSGLILRYHNKKRGPVVCKRLHLDAQSRIVRNQALRSVGS